MTTYTVVEEITKWDDSNIPNHTYILNDADKCVGYIKQGTTTPIKFTKPLMFDRRYRKFKTNKNVVVDFDPKLVDNSISVGTAKPAAVRSSTTTLRGNEMSKSKTLNWNDRFALIDHYQPTDEEACKIFGVSKDELSTARNMRASGVIVATDNIDVGSYGKLFGVTNATRTKTATKTVNTTMKSSTTTSTTKPQTASKKVKELKKRGRKGSNILDAFKAVPATPIPVEEFAQKQGVSVAVLRQAKRFDTTGIDGRVHVKKDKDSKTLVIWRSADE